MSHSETNKTTTAKPGLAKPKTIEEYEAIALSVSRSDLEDLVEAVDFQVTDMLGVKYMACAIRLTNGMMVTSKLMTPPSPADFNEETGRQVTFENALEKVRTMEVYHRHSRFVEAERLALAVCDRYNQELKTHPDERWQCSRKGRVSTKDGAPICITAGDPYERVDRAERIANLPRLEAKVTDLAGLFRGKQAAFSGLGREDDSHAYATFADYLEEALVTGTAD